MPFRRASAFSLAELTAHWNLGYASYFVPIEYTETMFAWHVQAGDLDLDSSVVLVEGGELVGFSYLGRREHRGWIGGVGVAPAHRGRGAGREIFAEQIAVVQRLRLAQVQLEVLRQNWAQKVYARAGFRTTRDLVILAATLPRDARPPGSARVTSRSAYRAHHARLHAAFPACWQREPPSLPGDPTLEVLAIGPADAPTAMLMIGPQSGELRIRDGAAADLAQAEAVLAALSSLHPGAAVTIVNEPEGSPLHRALVALGATETLAQHEMWWTASAA
ncbi:MAG TPA: GNAT family N-acetyltransferase [Kofleriaceae bacterium]